MVLNSFAMAEQLYIKAGRANIMRNSNQPCVGVSSERHATSIAEIC
jgi:hypothetical protein